MSAATFAASDRERFTDWLAARTDEDWTAATGHDFTGAIGDGTVADERFAAYLVQDYAFVAGLCDLVGHAAGQAPTVDAKVRLAEFLVAVGRDETDYFERSFDALDVPEHRRRDPDLLPVTSAFLDLLPRAAREGGYAESLAVLVPVEWVYREWAAAVDEPEPFYLAEWVQLHDEPEFAAFVDWLRSELDAVGPALAPSRQQRVARLFARAVTLERRFFDEAPGGPA